MWCRARPKQGGAVRRVGTAGSPQSEPPSPLRPLGPDSWKICCTAPKTRHSRRFYAAAQRLNGPTSRMGCCTSKGDPEARPDLVPIAVKRAFFFLRCSAMWRPRSRDRTAALSHSPAGNRRAGGSGSCGDSICYVAQWSCRSSSGSPLLLQDRCCSGPHTSGCRFDQARTAMSGRRSARSGSMKRCTVPARCPPRRRCWR